MAYFTAKMTYPSRRTFTFKTQGDKPSVYFDRGHFQFVIQTFPGLARPEEGAAGLSVRPGTF
jgi:hypothetical protein